MRRVVYPVAARRRVVLLSVLLSLSTVRCAFGGEAKECSADDLPCDDVNPVLPQSVETPLYERELCVASPESGEVFVFDAADLGSGGPKRRFGTDRTGIDGPRVIAFADAHGEMMVAEKDRITTWGIEDTGNLEPRRSLLFKASQIAYDATHDRLLAVAENRLFVFPRTASGNPTASVIRSVSGDPAHPWNARRMVYDDVRDEIILVGPEMLAVYDSNLVDATPKYAVFEPSMNEESFRDVAVDAAMGEIYALQYSVKAGWRVHRYRRALSGNGLDLRSSWQVPVDDQKLMKNNYSLASFGIDAEHNEAIIMPALYDSGLFWVFDLATGTFKYRIDGPRTQLSSPSGMTVNQARHEYAVSQTASRSLDTFARPHGTRSPSDVAPRRIGRPFGERPLSMAADIARNELYVTARNDPTVHVLSLGSGAEVRRVIDPVNPVGGKLLFDASADHLFVLDEEVNAVRMYERPTGEAMAPIATFEVSHALDMALDLDNQRLFVSGYHTVTGFSLQGGHAEPLFHFSPAVTPFQVPAIRPFPQPPPKGIRNIVVYNNQLFVSVFDGRLAVFPMIGSPPAPVNPPWYRAFEAGLGDQDDFLIDDRAPKSLQVVRRNRIDTYAPGLFAGPKPMRTIRGPSAGIGLGDSIALCR